MNNLEMDNTDNMDNMDNMDNQDKYKRDDNWSNNKRDSTYVVDSDKYRKMNEDKFKDVSNNDMLNILMVRALDSQNPTLFGDTQRLYKKLNFESVNRFNRNNHRKNYHNPTNFNKNMDPNDSNMNTNQNPRYKERRFRKEY